MSFVLARLTLPDGVSRQPGVVSASDFALFASAQAQAQAMREKALIEAHAILEHAHSEAKDLRVRAEHEGRLRLQQLLVEVQSAWDEARGQVEAAAIAVARVAFEQLCVDATWQGKVDAAVALAMQQLPASAVRIWMAPGAAHSGACAELAPSVVRETSHSLGSCAVAAEDGSVSAVADFDLARAEVEQALARWLRQAAAAEPAAQELKRQEEGVPS